MKDLYKILGVERSATAEEIKRAYRRLASQHHPDRGGDTARFQEIQQAYDTLSDPARRQQYDRPSPQFQWQGHTPGFADIFSMFQQGGFGEHFARTQRRGHARITLNIMLRDVALGGKRTVSLGTASGVSAVEIDIPQGVNHGDHVQYPGLGPGGVDLVVTYNVLPDDQWQRDGLDLITQRTVIIWDLILGGSIAVQDIYGNELMARIPAGTQPGTRLRLRDRGIRNRNGDCGDAYVVVQAQLPETIPQAIIDAIQQNRQ